MYGLTERDLDYIHQALQRIPEIERVILFGSRALGNEKQGSDVDLAIVGAKVSRKTLFQLSELLNEIYPLPYHFDLQHYEAITNEKLKRHIDQFGKIIG